MGACAGATAEDAGAAADAAPVETDVVAVVVVVGEQTLAGTREGTGG